MTASANPIQYYFKPFLLPKNEIKLQLSLPKADLLKLIKLLDYPSTFKQLVGKIHYKIPAKVDASAWHPTQEEVDEAMKPPSIPFNQQELTTKIDQIQQKTLFEINEKFHGLCELICNYILFNNLLTPLEETDEQHFTREITLAKLNVVHIQKSHILQGIFSLFQKILAFLFRIYPDNIFSVSEQHQIFKIKKENDTSVPMLNRTLLERKFASLPEGTTLKVELFIKSFFSFSGHSILLKKLNDNQYLLFDPNEGQRELNLSQLMTNLWKNIQRYSATDILFMKGSNFLNRMKEI